MHNFDTYVYVCMRKTTPKRWPICRIIMHNAHSGDIIILYNAVYLIIAFYTFNLLLCLFISIRWILLSKVALQLPKQHWSKLFYYVHLVWLDIDVNMLNSIILLILTKKNLKPTNQNLMKGIENSENLKMKRSDNIS